MTALARRIRDRIRAWLTWVDDAHDWEEER
jgi:hypothetical protein